MTRIQPSIPQIDIASQSTGVAITGNATATINGWSGQAGWNVTQNVFVQDPRPGTPGYYGDVFISSAWQASLHCAASVQYRLLPGKRFGTD